MEAARIRNFSIIAHIDHGKSTLSDRIMETCGAITDREKRAQMLDTLEVEREHGITVKSQTVRLRYKADDGIEYLLNLIDTPGHVDFTYEVSRSLAACEGALLIVDATQGVQAQTLANAYLASDQNLEILPVINKIDLPSAVPDEAKRQIEEIIGLEAAHAPLVSAKEGIGIHELLEKVVERIPPPKGDPDARLRALIFDSWFDAYRGALVLVRVVEGRIKKGEKLLLMQTGKPHHVIEMITLTPAPVPVDSLEAGEVGVLVCGIKQLKDTKIGDTVTHAERPTSNPLPGFKEVKPMVFSGLYPIDPEDYNDLRDALEKLTLNDSSITYAPEVSTALHLGFRCGFLGLLHMTITRERLQNEYNLDLISTVPSVDYIVTLSNGESTHIDNPAKWPDPGIIEKIEEPVLVATIHMPEAYVGGVLKLCEEYRGVQRDMRYLGGGNLILTYELPLAEVVIDFYDRLKSVSRGYASLDYHVEGHRESDIVKLSVLINGDPVDALSVMVHKGKAFDTGRDLVSKIKEYIPRQLYDVAIQAAIGARVIARETQKALRKNVTAKCYGGDISRKRKLLEKQKEGKKRMKQIGHVEIPQEAFLAILKRDGN